MILGLDTDVLVHWTMQGADKHNAVRHLVAETVVQGGRLAITQQVLWEFIHVTTDNRRFEQPLSMMDALRYARQWWSATEVIKTLPDELVLEQSCTLMERLGLGRKRILDTVLVVTLQRAGVHYLATLNSQDFKVFPALQIIEP